MASRLVARSSSAARDEALTRAADLLEQRVGAILEANATDHSRLAVLQAELERLADERETLETQWLASSESLEG